MNNYSTTTNVLGGIEIHIILDTIKFFNQSKDMNQTMKFFVKDNPFGLKMTKSRERFFAAIKKTYLSSFKCKDVNFFIKALSNISDISFKKKLLFLETCRQDRLFHEITTKLIQRKFKSNQRLINSAEVCSYLKNYEKGAFVAEWADSTLKIISSKYIAFMKKLGFFEKESRLNSLIAYPFVEVEVAVYLIYLLKYSGLSDNEAFHSSLFNALLLEDHDKVDLLKDGSLKGHFQFSFSGDSKADFALSLTEEELIRELSKKYG